MVVGFWFCAKGDVALKKHKKNHFFYFKYLQKTKKKKEKRENMVFLQAYVNIY